MLTFFPTKNQKLPGSKLFLILLFSHIHLLVFICFQRVSDATPEESQNLSSFFRFDSLLAWTLVLSYPQRLLMGFKSGLWQMTQTQFCRWLIEVFFQNLLISFFLHHSFHPEVIPRSRHTKASPHYILTAMFPHQDGVLLVLSLLFPNISNVSVAKEL